MSEATVVFDCFGASAALYVGGVGEGRSAEQAAAAGRDRLLEVHRRLSRFDPDSELCHLNASPAPRVVASPLLRRFVGAARDAALPSGGLVDATQLDRLEDAGYRESLHGRPPLDLRPALAVAPPRRPASPSPDARWRAIEVDEAAGTISRPPGLRLDSGGIGKGLAADLVAAGLRAHSTFAVDCAGDVRIGGSAGELRTVLVDDPFGGEPLHELQLAAGAVATSGIGRRAWLRGDGSPGHHLIDPGSGKPAFTGIVQVTALAPTALRAEVLAKTALLRGPGEAERALPHGGAIVLDDGSLRLVDGVDPALGAIAAPAAAAVR